MQNRLPRWLAATALSSTRGATLLAAAASPAPGTATSFAAFITVGESPKRIETGDLEGDGDPDLGSPSRRRTWRRPIPTETATSTSRWSDDLKGSITLLLNRAIP